jgi:hypothetical protein
MTLSVTARTQIMGSPRLGLIAEATGALSDGGEFVAERIVVRYNEAHWGAMLQFDGAIESLPADRLGIWVVSGRQVSVTEETRIVEDKGPAEVGAQVSVMAWRQPDAAEGDAVVATVIAVTRPAGQAEFEGVVEARPRPPMRFGIWKIAGRTVMVTNQTTFDETVAAALVGSTVKVKLSANTMVWPVVQSIVVTKGATATTGATLSSR